LASVDGGAPVNLVSLGLSQDEELNMKIHICRLSCFAAILFFAAIALAQTSVGAHSSYPWELTWVRAPNGNLQAILAGDDKKPGMYAYRVRFVSDFKNQPHFHPEDRIVTVLSGTLYVGFGEQFSESAMKALPAGSIWTEPMKEPHYVWAKDGEVVIQVIGVGPTGVTLIQPRQ
jgi:quercetin dioxygenase-like cupin family protein